MREERRIIKKESCTGDCDNLSNCVERYLQCHRVVWDLPSSDKQRILLEVCPEYRKYPFLYNYSLEDNKTFLIITFIMESTLQIIIIHVREKKGKLSHFISLWTKITNSITILLKESRKGDFKFKEFVKILWRKASLFLWRLIWERCDVRLSLGTLIQAQLE